MVPFIISLVVFMMFGGIVSAVILNTQAEKRKRYLQVIQGGSANQSKKKMIDPKDQRRSDLAKKLQESGDEKPSKGPRLSELIMQAGLTTSVKKFWLYSVVFAVVMTVLAKVFGFSPFVIGMTAITSLLGLPKLFLKRKAAKRQKEFLQDFAEALESMRRLLKAGMPVSEAINMVSREFQGPMGEEMGRIFDQQKIGTPLPEAVLEGSKRIPITEMQMFATAIAIQTQTGSSLSEVLENLANVIRARFKLKRKIKSLSSEAIASASIIGALPVVVAGGMYFINREYIEILFTDPTGKMWLAGAIISMGIGVFVMKQMINFKV